MIRVAMGDDDEIQLGEINVERFDVMLKDFDVIAGVKQDALSIVFDERGETPVLCYLRGIGKCVVKDCDAVRGQKRRKRRND